MSGEDPSFRYGDSAIAMCRKGPRAYMDSASSDAGEYSNVLSTAVDVILKEKPETRAVYVEKFLPNILSFIDTKEPVVAEPWLDILLDTIAMLPLLSVKHDILPFAVTKSQLSQPVQSRIISCKILGKIATKLDNTDLQNEIVPLAHSLCQDVNGEVRASMCRQLPNIACGLKSDAVKQSLLPLLVELSVDEEPTVRLAAIHTSCSLLPVFPSDVLHNTMVPLFMKVCDQAASMEDDILCAISEKYGQFCCGLKSCLSENEKMWFLKFFKQMQKLGHSTKHSSLDQHYEILEPYNELQLLVRQNCAYNFPAMVQFCGSYDFETVLYPSFASLARDKMSSIRRCVAAGFHEVARLLDNGELIRQEFIFLVRDDVREVLSSLVPNIAVTLPYLFKTQSLHSKSSEASISEVVRALLKCELVLSLSTDWRIHATMLSQLEEAPRSLSPDVVYSQLCGVLFHRVLSSRALPCRLAASKTLLILLRHVTKTEHRNEIHERIVTELCHNSNYHTRQLYIKMCGFALDIFSSIYFKQYFFFPLLSMANDPVPNVLIVLCGLLPRLKALIQCPVDTEAVYALESAVEAIRNSKRQDRDVIAALHSACKEMDSISLYSNEFEGVMSTEDACRFKEEQRLKNRIPESPKLVTVNMKSLVEGKKTTLISLQSPDVLGALSVKNSTGNLSQTATNIGIFPNRPDPVTKIIAALNSNCDQVNNISTQFSTLRESLDSLNSRFPVLHEDEFYIDAGVPLPERLTESRFLSHSLAISSDLSRSKKPNLRDLLFQNSTLLAQVANRRSDFESQIKSLEEIKPLSFNKQEEQNATKISLTSSSTSNKLYSQISKENTSSHLDVKYSGSTAQLSSVEMKRERSGFSLLPKATYDHSINKSSTNSKLLLPQRINFLPPKESKVSQVDKRNVVHLSFQGEASNTKENVNHHSSKGSGGGTSKLELAGSRIMSVDVTDNAKPANGKISKFQNGAAKTPALFVARNPQSGRNSMTTTVTITKTSSAESPHRRRSTMDIPLSTEKTKSTHFVNKRFSLGDHNHTFSEKKVSLSSIGINGSRRLYGTTSRPQSCLITMHHKEKYNSEASKCLSEESLTVGLPEKRGSKNIKHVTIDVNRAETSTSRIPRGGASCHSSPGNSRSTSPLRQLHTAPCSPGSSRSTSPTNRNRAKVSLSSIKLQEASKLPIRKYNHHV